MPYSDAMNDGYIFNWIKEIQPWSVLDVGPGAGKYGQAINSDRSKYGCHFLDAVEVWEPYVDQFELLSIYDEVDVKDVRHLFPHDFDYSLVIFGDVLEHMTKDDALEVLDTARYSARTLISLPIVHYPQGHSHGNPYEEHVKDDWSLEEAKEAFYDFELLAVSDLTAVFVR